jgi:FMN phosphatase YigB (HAD superfamily)
MRPRPRPCATAWCAVVPDPDRTVVDYDAVTFDYWHTLFHAPDPEDAKGRRREWMDAVLRRFELEVADVRLREAIDTVARAAQQNWIDGRQYYAPEASAELLALLDIEAEAELMDAVIVAYGGEDQPPTVVPTPNVATALAGLKEEGVRIGIVCDVGLAPSTLLRSHLEVHDLLRFFDHWSFSDEVGMYKPSPKIFEHALGGLGVDDASRAAHVGDLRRTDIAGAQAMGKTAVRYRGSNDDPGDAGDPEGDVVIDDHADLVATLAQLA